MHAKAEGTDVVFEHDNAFTLMTGLEQDLIWGGGNIAAQFVTGKFTFEYSHGFNLNLNNLNGLGLSSSEKNEGLQVRVPWTTGFGVGYRLTDALHVALEFKPHRYNETDPNGGGQASYTAFSIGPGVFYDLYLWKGLLLQPALRWWPNVATTLPGNSVNFTHADGSTYVQPAHDFGVFFNVSLGWTF